MRTYLESEEVKQLEGAATLLRDKLLIRLLSHLGCRISEVLAQWMRWISCVTRCQGPRKDEAEYSCCHCEKSCLIFRLFMGRKGYGNRYMANQRVNEMANAIANAIASHMAIRRR
jgi:hypothetical protein